MADGEVAAMRLKAEGEIQDFTIVDTPSEEASRRIVPGCSTRSSGNWLNSARLAGNGWKRCS
jgi:hypothetical protein